MIFQFIEFNRSSFPDDRMCQVLKVSVIGYYAYRKSEKSHRQKENEKLLFEIRIGFCQSRETYRRLRITAFR